MVEKEKYKPVKPEEKFPKSVDINPTAVCNLDCSFCWGPRHDIKDGVSTEGWKKIISCFGAGGTENIVFTGGEPLIRKDLPEIARHAKEEGMHTTLSTNTLLLKNRGGAVLPYIDEIGIPLDGSSPELNSRMRIGNSRSFETSLAAIDMVSEQYPHINTTVRTVVSNVNKEDIPAIGKVLEEKAGKFDRWKLYQFAPVNMGEDNRSAHEVSDDEFRKVTELVQRDSSLPITIYPNSDRTGRYVFVGPQGDLFGVGEDGNYVTVANLLQDEESSIILQRMQTIFDPQKNAKHGKKV